MEDIKPQKDDDLSKRIISVFLAHTDSEVTQKTFEDELADVSLEQILPCLNLILKEGRIEVLINSDGAVSWRMRQVNNLDKLKSLADIEECLVYNCVGKYGNEGATVKNISIETKLPQNRLPRLLKALIMKKLVKELPLLTGNKQKIYLLSELEPSRILAANTLFAGEAGVDGEFVAMLRTACLKYMQDKADAASLILDPLASRNASYTSVEELHRFIINAKLCTVTLTNSDVKTILDALMFGGELDMKQSVITASDQDTNAAESISFMYRISPRTPSFAYLSRIPCTICPSRKDCRPGGAICPTKCKYYTAFLDF